MAMFVATPGSFTGTLNSTNVLSFGGDAGISRVTSNVVGVGNGTAGDVSGTIEAGAFQVNTGANGYFGPSLLSLPTAGVFGFSSTSNATLAADTSLSKGSAGVVCIGTGAQGSFAGTAKATATIIAGANGETWTHGQATELLTIAAAATTDTSANLLPANSIIEAVVVRVTTLIPTAVTFTVGDATVAARFATGVAVAANTTAVGLTHCDQTGTSGPKQVAAAKIRITPSGTPASATGVVRITVFYRQFVAPTS